MLELILMETKLIVATFFVSLCACIFSVFIIVIVSTYPISSSDKYTEEQIADYMQRNKGVIITEKELERLDKIASEIINKNIQKAEERDRSLSFIDGFYEVKKRAIMFTWIPWFLLPFIVSFAKWRWLFLSLLLPMLLILPGIFHIPEVMVFGVFVFIGKWICDYFQIGISLAKIK